MTARTNRQQVTPELRQWIVEQAQAGHGAEAVLKAMGVPDDEAERTLRVSFGWNTTREEVERFIVLLLQAGVLCFQHLRPST